MTGGSSCIWCIDDKYHVTFRHDTSHHVIFKHQSKNMLHSLMTSKIVLLWFGARNQIFSLCANDFYFFFLNDNKCLYITNSFRWFKSRRCFSYFLSNINANKTVCNVSWSAEQVKDELNTHQFKNKTSLRVSQRQDTNNWDSCRHCVCCWRLWYLKMVCKTLDLTFDVLGTSRRRRKLISNG